jgi:hypothetical protein
MHFLKEHTKQSTHDQATEINDGVGQVSIFTDSSRFIIIIIIIIIFAFYVLSSEPVPT